MAKVIEKTKSNATWQRVPIKEIYLGLYDGPHATPKPSDEGPVFLGIKNITEDGKLDLSEIRHISEEEYPKWTKRVTPESGDIVFSYEATLNRYSIIPSGFRGCLGRRMALIRPNPEIVNTKFLFYTFFGADWRVTISANTLSGSTVDRIPLTNFPNFEINLPPLSTQKKIADILSAYDDLIENNTRRIAILEAMAQALYREWFVLFRYPGHGEVPLVDSPLGPIPQGWEVKKLGDVAEINSTSITTRTAPSVVQYIDISSVTTGQINNISELAFEDAPSRARRIVQHGDTIWSSVRPNRRSFALVIDPLPHTIVSTGFAVIRPVSIPYSYQYLATTTQEFTDYLTNNATGSAYPAVNTDDFNKADILVPTPDVLSAFHQQVEPTLLFKQNLQKRNDNLRQTRDLLLPRLISGQLDISELEIV